MFNKKGVSGRAILFILMIIVVTAAIYFTFFFYYKCDDLACFQAHQEKCSKTKFTNDAEEATWFYKIKGKEKGECKIYIELIYVKKGDVSVKKLEGKSMDCYLPLETMISPESDISKCHGVLKEELQDIIINKLHAYIVGNIGQIGEELGKVI